MTTSKHSVEHQCLIFQTEPRILEEDEGLPEQLITCEITPNIEMVAFEENESDSVDEIADFCHLDSHLNQSIIHLTAMTMKFFIDILSLGTLLNIIMTLNWMNNKRILEIDAE